MTQPPLVMRTQLLDPLAEFAARNRVALPLREGQKDFDTLFYQAPASDPEAGGFAIQFEDPDCPAVSLPAGRMVTFGHIGAWITDLSATLPMAPLPFAQAYKMAENMDEVMRAAGWERIFHKPEYSPQSIADKPGANFHTVARYRVCGRPGTLASIAVLSFGDSPTGYMVPPTAALQAPDDSQPDLYLLNVDISAADSLVQGANLRDGVERLAYARREAEAGDRFAPLSLQTWLESSDWRPEVTANEPSITQTLP